MLSEFRKSINAILYDRIASPLSGTFILTWLVWNWKIIYLSLFVDDKFLDRSKLEIIQEEYLNIWDGLLYPLFTTIILLTVYQFVAEFAYRLWLYFKKRKSDLREKFENKRLLTLEQSIQLRLEMKSQEERFEKINEDKNKEIELLRNQIEKFTRTEDDKAIEPHFDEDALSSEDLDYVLNKKGLIKTLQQIHNRGGEYLPDEDGPKREHMKELELHDLIDNQTPDTYYKVTSKGKKLLKDILKK